MPVTMEMDHPEVNRIGGERFRPESALEHEPGKGLGQYTVFLVEDDHDDQQQLLHILRKSPYIYNVLCFDNGDDLIGHFASAGYYSGTLVRHIPTLIMLDIHIPGADGIQILRSLKDHPLTEEIPVIIVTGDTSNQAALDAYKYKANGFITKPLSLDQVHEVIHKGRSWPHKS